jgi:energy-converting hydrogenase A subunit B
MGGAILNEIIAISIGAVLSWINFVFIDIWMGLPEAPGVRGAKAIGKSIENRGGDLGGGYFSGNIVCSPDASAGTLLASCGYYAFGSPEGGVIAALFVYFGNRICADQGYAGTTGALTATVLIWATSYIGLAPQNFILGMVIAALTIQGLYHPLSSKLIGKMARTMNRKVIQD